MNFWQTIQKPIIGLAPMDGITDAAYRYMVASKGSPDVLLTEFVSVDGLEHAADKLFQDLLYSEIERPVVAQLFGNQPEMFYLAAQIICELGFDGLDINMGCPAKSVVHRGAGAGLINQPELARSIIVAANKGITDWVKSGPAGLNHRLLAKVKQTKEQLTGFGVTFRENREILPVSVKTRIGYDSIVIEKWLAELVQEQPANISVHGRTLKQLYSGQSNWEAIALGAEIIRDFNQGRPPEQQITYIGNGDVHNFADISTKIAGTGIDGVLVGRATFGNPWFFKNLPEFKKDPVGTRDYQAALNERIDALLEHTKIFLQFKGEQNLLQMRKHWVHYIKGFANAAQLRGLLVHAESLAEVENLVRSFVQV